MWEQVHNDTYRQMSKDWVNRVKSRSAAAKVYLQAVAKAILDHCTYLKEPIKSELEA